MRGLLFSRGRFGAAILALLALSLLSGLGQAKPRSKSLDLTDTISKNVILKNFAAMLQASNLASFYSSRGPFTLFAPVDSAFSKLPPGTLEALLRPENNEALQRIILFQLVSGKRTTAKDLLTLKSLVSCEGNPLPLHTTRSGVEMVLKAKIIHADIRCANGMMHEIDTVLVPPDLDLTKLAPPAPPAPTTNAMSNPAADTNAPPDASSIPVAVPESSATNATPDLTVPGAPAASPH